MRIVIAYLLLVTLPSIAHAQTPLTERIEISKAGIYTTDAKHNYQQVSLLQSTTTIPAKIGIEFGVTFRLVGKPNGARVDLRYVTLIPSPGTRNPATGKITLREERSLLATLGQEATRLYVFEERWELIPGTWTFEFWQGDRKLGAQSFTMVKP